MTSKSPAWGSKHLCPRGERLESWATANDLISLNKGTNPTCIRAQGESTVDVTWITANLIRFAHDWSVQEEVETYSDHSYIEFNIGDKVRSAMVNAHRKISKNKYPRWSLKEEDTDFNILEEFVEWKCEQLKQTTDMAQLSVDETAQWIKETMTEAADLTMKRVKGPQKKKQVHWWCDSIKTARSLCIKKRRDWTREKRKKVKDLEKIIEAKKSYKAQKKKLSIEIYEAKKKAWKELISTINEDPWGIPYRLVLGKLQTSTPSLTETLDQQDLNTLLLEL